MDNLPEMRVVVATWSRGRFSRIRQAADDPLIELAENIFFPILLGIVDVDVHEQRLDIAVDRAIAHLDFRI